jgi:GntR family transcriptional regulator
MLGSVTNGSPGKAVWQQIKADLEDRLAEGEFDDRFPTDRALVEEYGVSRHTVREAVRELQAAGLVTRRRGKGSFRTPASHAQPLGTLYSLFRSIEAAGEEPLSVVLAREERRDEAVAKVLGLEQDAPLFHLERVRLSDRIPLAVDHVWMPLELGRQLLDVDFSSTGFYTELRELCGIVPERGVEVSRAVAAEAEPAARLGIEQGAPVFEVERRTWYRDAPLEWRVTIVRGDRYAFRAEWASPWEDATSQLLPDTGAVG